MPITHAVFGEVFGEGLEPVADVGDCVPVYNGGSIISVAECECLADGLSQLCAIEAVVVPKIGMCVC